MSERIELSLREVTESKVTERLRSYRRCFYDLRSFSERVVNLICGTKDRTDDGCWMNENKKYKRVVNEISIFAVCYLFQGRLRPWFYGALDDSPFIALLMRRFSSKRFNPVAKSTIVQSMCDNVSALKPDDVEKMIAFIKEDVSEFDAKLMDKACAEIIKNTRIMFTRGTKLNKGLNDLVSECLSQYIK